VISARPKESLLCDVSLFDSPAVRCDLSPPKRITSLRCLTFRCRQPARNLTMVPRRFAHHDQQRTTLSQRRTPTALSCLPCWTMRQKALQSVCSWLDCTRGPLPCMHDPAPHAQTKLRPSSLPLSSQQVGRQADHHLSRRLASMAMSWTSPPHRRPHRCGWNTQ